MVVHKPLVVKRKNAILDCGVAAPAAANTENGLLVAYVDTNDGNNIVMCLGTFDSYPCSWSSPVTINQFSRFGPALSGPNPIGVDPTVYLVFVAMNSTNTLLLCKSPDGGLTWERINL